MELLKERIRREGKVLPGNIIKVDGFLNHRVDTALMSQLADEFAKYFDVKDITMVLTAEASGIALAEEDSALEGSVGAHDLGSLRGMGRSSVSVLAGLGSVTAMSWPNSHSAVVASTSSLSPTA